MLPQLTFPISFYFYWILMSVAVSTNPFTVEVSGLFLPHHSHWVIWPWTRTFYLVPEFTQFKVGIVIENFVSEKALLLLSQASWHLWKSFPIFLAHLLFPVPLSLASSHNTADSLVRQRLFLLTGGGQDS